jgi:hypothetical protein
MIEFDDLPYEFIGPQPCKYMMFAAGLANGWFSLPHGIHKVKPLTIRNAESLDTVENGSKRVLFLPNHSTHSDPEIMYELQRRLKRPSLFMAAYDVFLRSKIKCWVMRKSGAFSVDRDSSDKESMKTAIQAMVDGKYALTIFPEGNVFFMNDRPGPFLEGAAYMAMSAQKELGADEPIYAIPVSIKASHLTDQRQAVREKIAEIAAYADTSLDADADDLANLTRIGLSLLQKRLRELNHEVPDLDGSLRDSLDKCAEIVIASVEDEMEQKVRPNHTLLERAKALRRAIHKIRMEPEKKAEHPEADEWAERNILALRILSYTGDYLSENTSLDRVAETVEKLLEDMTSVSQKAFAKRRVFVQLGDPINLTEYLEAYAGKGRRQVLDDLTQRFENTVQSGMDAINADNPCEGAKPF